MGKFTVADFTTPVSILAVVVINLGITNWIDVATISDQYFTALTPAGYAFSIWLLIWATQLLGIVWLLYRPGDADDDDTKRKKKISLDIAPWYFVGAVLEITWLFLYGEATKATFAMASVALIYASFAFTQALFAVEAPDAPKIFTRDGTGLIAAGSAVNGAWLSVAGVVCILIFQDYPMEHTELALVLLALVAGFGMFVSIRTCSLAYPLTLVWALVAVVLVGDRLRSVRAIAGVAAAVFALTALLNFARRVLGTIKYAKENAGGDDDDDDDDDDDAKTKEDDIESQAGSKK